MATKPITVSLHITVTITEPDDWTTAFGIEGRGAITQDVKEYITNNVREGALGGVFQNGEVTATFTCK